MVNEDHIQMINIEVSALWILWIPPSHCWFSVLGETTQLIHTTEMLDSMKQVLLMATTVHTLMPPCTLPHGNQFLHQPSTLIDSQHNDQFLSVRGVYRHQCFQHVYMSWYPYQTGEEISHNSLKSKKVWLSFCLLVVVLRRRNWNYGWEKKIGWKFWRLQQSCSLQFLSCFQLEALLIIWVHQ